MAWGLRTTARPAMMNGSEFRHESGHGRATVATRRGPRGLRVDETAGIVVVCGLGLFGATVGRTSSSCRAMMVLSVLS
jgi:hypothetical protein